jgi:hypothetical protein
MTEFKGDSKVEVIPGSTTSRGGPHPAKLHVDEVELMVERHDGDKMEQVTTDDRGLIQFEREDWDDN